MKIKYNTNENTYISTKAIQSIENIYAIGIFAYICSYPDNFVFSKEQVREHSKMKKAEFYEAIDYLLSMGYIENQNEGFFTIINK